MAIDLEIRKRIDGLREDLDEAISHHKSRAISDHWIGLTLMSIALLSSAAAGVGGLFLWQSAKLTGGLALIPSVMAVIATTMKFQGKSNWHYRKLDMLIKLRRKLLFELPEGLAGESIADITRSWSEVDEEMQKEWEREFSLSWTGFLPPNV